jgi:hypothetical protein
MSLGIYPSLFGSLKLMKVLAGLSCPNKLNNDKVQEEEHCHHEGSHSLDRYNVCIHRIDDERGTSGA